MKNKKIKSILYKFICFLVAVLIGLWLTMMTLLKIIPGLDIVRKTFATEDIDWGADLPAGALCYVTKGLPVISENYEFGQYVLFHDKEGNNKTGVVERVDENSMLVYDSCGNEYTVSFIDCTGVITFYIPKLGKYYKEK